MLAVANSMGQNAAVIQAQTQQTINQIHAIGAAAKAQADSAHASNDAHNAAVEAHHWDNMAKASKSFQEYTLDQSVVVDKNTGERAQRGTKPRTYSSQPIQIAINMFPGRIFLRVWTTKPDVSPALAFVGATFQVGRAFLCF